MRIIILYIFTCIFLYACDKNNDRDVENKLKEMEYKLAKQEHQIKKQEKSLSEPIQQGEPPKNIEIEGITYSKTNGVTYTHSPCYIKNIYQNNGNYYLVADFIQRKHFYNEHGYEIINQNPKLRTFRFTPSSQITIDWKTATINQLNQYINSRDFNITVAGEKIIEISSYQS